VFARLGIRVVSSIVGIFIGIVLSVALLDDFSASAEGIVVATFLFWIVFLVVNFIALRVLIRQPSVALAGILALASTIVSLFIVSALVSGLRIRGVTDYFAATIIIWACTAVSDMIGRRKIRERRVEARAERRS
jgi:hypothetical protein